MFGDVVDLLRERVNARGEINDDFNDSKEKMADECRARWRDTDVRSVGLFLTWLHTAFDRNESSMFPLWKFWAVTH